jgi:hypothetical protein
MIATSTISKPPDLSADIPAEAFALPNPAESRIHFADQIPLKNFGRTQKKPSKTKPAFADFLLLGSFSTANILFSLL